MAAYIRTLSQLPEISAAQLAPNSYFEVSNPVSAVTDINGQSINVNYIYASKKIRKSEVAKDIIQDVRADLKTTEHISGQNFGWLYDDYVKLIKEDYTLSGRKTFTSNPKHVNEITNFNSASQQEYSVNLSVLKEYSNLNSSPAIGPTFGFVTYLSGDNNDGYYNIFKINGDGGNVTVENSPSFVFSPTSAKEIAQNKFIFRIRSGERESKEWIAPASGIFTCYGWLDEIHNEKVSNENRWVALMGKQEQLGVWTTLQVQPFIKNNYLSYVGFTFPVHKGMKLKVVTGFAVGSNSDKYFKNGSSLANNIANAFLGGIYTGLSVDNGVGNKYNYTNIDSSVPVDGFDPTHLCNLICTQISHETSCDIETDKKIGNLSTEVNLRSKYIDTVSQQGTYRTATIMLYENKYVLDNNGIIRNYKQKYWNNDGRGSTLRDIWHINTEDLNNDFASMGFSPGITRNYYAPPDHEEEYGGIKNGIVERAYTRNAIPLGAVFSDGMRMFYKVSQDCHIIIKIYSDIAPNGATATACSMLYSFENSYENTRCITFCPDYEFFGISDPGKTISLPVKAGTLFMFESWVREYPVSQILNNELLYKKDGTLRDEFARELWKWFNLPAIIPNYGGLDNTLGEIYKNNTYTYNANTLHGTDTSYTTYLICPDQSNNWQNHIPSPFFNEIVYNGSKFKRGKIADIVEIPT